jgi:tRNA (guanine-N7-)-methyltransferase
MSSTVDRPSPNYAELAPLPPEGEIFLYDLFPQYGEIELEIGTGRGMFLFERVRRSPNSYVLGIEIKKKWAYKVSQRCEREGIDRARIMTGDARSILSRIRPAESVSRIFLHFPDPWWKKRHIKRRILSRDLLDDFLRLLKPGGELFIQTDVEERAREYATHINSNKGFIRSPGSGFVSENPFRARSNREKRAESDGIPIFRILAVKTAHLGDLSK